MARGEGKSVAMEAPFPRCFFIYLLVCLWVSPYPWAGMITEERFRVGWFTPPLQGTFSGILGVVGLQIAGHGLDFGFSSARATGHG